MNDGQIYVTIGRLEKAGLVTRTGAGASPDRPDRKVYVRTPAGQERVTEWLTEVSWPKPDLAEFHLKLHVDDADRVGEACSGSKPTWPGGK